MNTLLPLYRVRMAPPLGGTPCGVSQRLSLGCLLCISFLREDKQARLGVQDEEEQSGRAPAWVSLRLPAPSCERVQSPSRGLQ